MLCVSPENKVEKSKPNLRSYSYDNSTAPKLRAGPEMSNFMPGSVRPDGTLTISGPSGKVKFSVSA